MAGNISGRRGRPTKDDVETITPRLLAAATDVFLASGYDQANMAEVAKAAGCSKRTLYVRFPSKLELFKACIELLVEERLTSVKISTVKADGLQPQLVSVATTVREYASSEFVFQLHRLIVQDGRRIPELQSIIDRFAWRPAVRFVKCLLGEHFADISDDHLTFLSEQFLAVTALQALHSNVVNRKLEGDEQGLVEFFLHGCSAFTKRMPGPEAVSAHECDCQDK